MKITSFAVLFLALSFTVPASADVPWMIDSAHTSIHFAVKHLMISTVRGNFSNFSGTVTADPKSGKISSAEGTVQVNSIDTANQKRDQHLLTPDFFDLKNFQTINLKSKSVTWNENNVTMEAALTIKDVTRPITLEGEFFGARAVNFGQGENIHAGYTFNGRINRKDFNLNFAALVDGTAVVGNDVDIRIDLEIIHPTSSSSSP